MQPFTSAFSSLSLLLLLVSLMILAVPTTAGETVPFSRSGRVVNERVPRLLKYHRPRRPHTFAGRHSGNDDNQGGHGYGSPGNDNHGYGGGNDNGDHHDGGNNDGGYGHGGDDHNGGGYGHGGDNDHHTPPYGHPSHSYPKPPQPTYTPPGYPGHQGY